MPSVKEIYHKIDDVRIEADSINLNVDGLEALASTQQADIADIKADLANGVTINQPVAVTDNNGSLTVDGTVTANGGDFAGASGDSLPAKYVLIAGRNQNNQIQPLGVSADGTIDLPNGIETEATIKDGDGNLLYFNNGNVPISGTVTAASDKGSVSEASTQSITTGGTHQQVFASNASRKYLLIQNISDTDMYLGLGFNPSNTTPAGLLLAKSGGGIVFESSYIPTSEVRIVCATTGKRFVALQG